jgi:hypothetical protein
MADRRDPKPTRMETLRQQRAFLFAFVYELIARGYGRDAPLDLRVQHVRREYLRAVADEQQKRRVA